MRALRYHLSAVIDLSFLKVKSSSVDRMSMFPALQYNITDRMVLDVTDVTRIMQRRVFMEECINERFSSVSVDLSCVMTAL